MQNNRKTILFIAMSLDGYIAKFNDDMSFLDIVAKEGEDYGYFDFINTIDTVIMGRKTYDWVMTQVPEFPHEDKKSYIITRTSRPSINNIEFYSGNLAALVSHLKQVQGKNIFIDGGAEIVHSLLKENLIDELIISIIPILLGEGVALFKEGRPEHNLQLLSAKSYEKGLVQLHYVRL